MDLTQLANLGEFIGGVAVLVTLVYLAVQVRQGNKQLKIQTGNAVQALNIDAWEPLLIGDNGLLVAKGMDSYETLSES